MFNWVWELLYGISKSIFAIIDDLLSCANMLCGIEPIKYQGTEMDFLTFLLRNRNIYYGFSGAVIIGVILVIIFSVFAIMRAIATDKGGLTPAQIYVRVGKTLLTFIFIPVCLVVLIYLTNIFMQSLYQATLGGSPDGVGRFLAGAFGQNALKSGKSEYFYLEKEFNYRSTSNMASYVNLKDYDFFFSWIAGIAILFAIASSLLMFVDRAISIVLLFIFAPISLSTAVLDDGQRFKLWRDQFLVKFLTGYGCIIGINVYALVVAAVTKNDLVFFENSTLNYMMKLCIIAGGAVSMNRLMALVGNLIAQGAGSNELRDNAIATAQMRGLGMRAFGAAKSVVTSPFRAARSSYNFYRDQKEYGMLSAIGRRLGLNVASNYGKMSRTAQTQARAQMQERENLRKTGSFDGTGDKKGKSVGDIINGGSGNNNGGGGGGNSSANNKKNNVGNKLVENSIMNNNKNSNNNANK